MDDDDANWEFKDFHLPIAFWAALWEIRCYLIRSHTSTGWLYGPCRTQDYRENFDLADEYLKKTLLDLGILDECGLLEDF